MPEHFSFWIWATIITQLLTATMHSLSFIAPAKPRNDKEKELIDITTNYKLDTGGGIKRSFYNLFVGVSSCFTLIYIFGAVSAENLPMLQHSCLLLESTNSIGQNVNLTCNRNIAP